MQLVVVAYFVKQSRTHFINIPVRKRRLQRRSATRKSTHSLLRCKCCCNNTVRRADPVHKVGIDEMSSVYVYVVSRRVDAFLEKLF